MGSGECDEGDDRTQHSNLEKSKTHIKSGTGNEIFDSNRECRIELHLTFAMAEKV